MSEGFGRIVARARARGHTIDDGDWRRMGDANGSVSWTRCTEPLCIARLYHDHGEGRGTMLEHDCPYSPRPAP